MVNQRSLTILGATGSVGKSTLDLVRERPDRFNIKGLTAHTNFESLARLALEFRPDCVVIADETYYKQLKGCLSGTDIVVHAGEDALFALAAVPVDCIVGAIVGIAGLGAVHSAIQAGQKIALANKETLVVAGHLIMPMLPRTGASILPLDSEHNAIFQCLKGESGEVIKDVVLTASGGPFRQMSREQMRSVNLQQALKHPNWKMGPKVTIDSATLMNKGLELIEAKWLFGLPVEKIKAVIHPQSVVHGLVNFADGSCIAHMGSTDMRIPISYALDYPERMTWQVETLDLVKLSRLDFFEIDLDRFPCFKLAKTVLSSTPEYAVILNAANEVAVAAFLNDQLAYSEIAEVVDRALNRFSAVTVTKTLDDVIGLDCEVRNQMSELKKDVRDTVKGIKIAVETDT